ncbi:lymphocyte antigen 75 [Procambarus clarkii]|uniref:lymphocyte antigen 75 n=1 Tax=Procambarus clarkii TaxID=6728 RepID=UPI001E672F73|nr:lymphocyte antigen 75-like [Procambarus clarkii]
MRLEREPPLRLLLSAALALTATALPAEEDFVDYQVPLVATIASGVNQLSTLLEDRRVSCDNRLSDPVEKKVLKLEKLVETQWERLAEVEEEVKNMEKIMDVFLQYRENLRPTVAGEGCVEPFEQAAGGCFWAHKNPSLSWKQARKRCQQEGGDLATPDNLKAVRNYLRLKLGSDWWYLWLGGKITGPRKWSWLDGREIESSDDDWAETNESGDCVALNSGRGYRAMAWDCEKHNWYLCERKMS